MGTMSEIDAQMRELIGNPYLYSFEIEKLRSDEKKFRKALEDIIQADVKVYRTPQGKAFKAPGPAAQIAIVALDGKW